MRAVGDDRDALLDQAVDDVPDRFLIAGGMVRDDKITVSPCDRLTAG